MEPRVSVILPTHDRAYVLWRAIESVLDQTEPDWELIVVDDGSTDCTPRLLEEFRDSRIRWVPEILIDYRQVHGTGADGICPEAREDGELEVAGRQYLLDKWGSPPDFDAHDKLDIDVSELTRFRADE